MLLKKYSIPLSVKRIEEEKIEKDFGTETEDIPFSDIPGFTGDKEKDSETVVKDLGKAVDEENKKKGGGSPANAGANIFLDAAGVDSSNMTLKEKVTSMKEIYTELLGYDDEDESELFWLNMAQIGFLVASGQDPNALANIAAGFAQGASKFAEDKRDKKARDDKITLAAFGEVMADERASKKFNRDLQIAKIRASASSDNKYTAERERSRIKELIYKTPFDYPGLLGDDATPDPDKVNKYLDQVVEIADAEPVIVTQEEAIADAKKVIEERPDLKDKVIEILKKKGYNTEGL